MRILLHTPLTLGGIRQATNANIYLRKLEEFFGGALGGNDLKVAVYQPFASEPAIKALRAEPVIFDRAYDDTLLMHEAVREKLGRWQPEIVVEWGTARSLNQLYPQAITLHCDSALFTRRPFGFYGCCDPFGIQSRCYPVRFAREIGRLKISRADRAQIERLREGVREHIAKINPVAETLARYRRCFEKVVLLAVDGIMPWTHDETGCIDTYHVFHQAMAKIPPEVGVVLTQHPDVKAITTESAEEAQRRYPNLIYLPELEHYFSSSIFTFDFVDAIVNLSSTARQQGTLIWDKNLIFDSRHDINRPYLNRYSFAEFEKGLRAPPHDQSSVLYWFMRHYSLPLEYVQRPGFLDDYFAGMLKNKRREWGIGPHFYPAIDKLEMLVNHLLGNLSADIKKPQFANVPPPPHEANIERLARYGAAQQAKARDQKARERAVARTLNAARKLAREMEV